jgi:hypothetical protein
MEDSMPNGHSLSHYRFIHSPEDLTSYRLSKAQERALHLALEAPDSAMANLTCLISYDRDVEFEPLNQAINQVIQGDSTLRMALFKQGSGPNPEIRQSLTPFEPVLPGAA